MNFKLNNKKNTAKLKKRPQNSLSLRIVALIGILSTFAIFIFFQLYSIYQIELVKQDDIILFENSIPLLAVNEIDGEIGSASTIPLNLRITNGEGNIFINLNSYTELDTQISITNAQNTICTLLELPCNSFDFYYTFESGSLILRGPSASTSIGLLMYATINNLSLDNSFALTGNLNSNGIVGRVGGTFEKVQEAHRRNIQRVYVPFNSLNQTQIEELSKIHSLEVIQDLDILSIIKREFPQQTVSLDVEPFETKLYSSTMKYIAQELCSLSEIYIEKLEEKNLINHSFIQNSLGQFNFSKIAFENEEFYSQGSFCYSANIGLKTLLNVNTVEFKINEFIINTSEHSNITTVGFLENLILNKTRVVQDQINSKKEQYNPRIFPETLDNLNDIFVYLLVQNRIFEAQEFIEDSSNQFSLFKNNSMNSTQLNELRIFNSTNKIDIFENRELFLSIQQLSLAQERLTTVEQWGSVFGSSNKRESELSFLRAQEICRLYISDTSVLNQLLLQFSIDVFTSEIERIEESFQENPFLCIFNAMQLKGRMNTILTGSSAVSDDNETISLIDELQRITVERMQFKSQGELPLIPFISYEYSRSLQEVGNLQSALQYIQLALSYSELNIILSSSQQEVISNTRLRTILQEKSTLADELTPFQQQKIQEIKKVQNISYLFLILTLGFGFYLIKN
ncbi:MAG: S16 family serine protease [Candidatus Woesearchaeota archaeon]